MAAMSKKKKTNSKVKGKGKTSNVKINNKNQTKPNKKKSKLKDKKKKVIDQTPHVDETELEADCDISLNAEDLAYYKANLSNVSFINQINECAVGKGKKRKRKANDDAENIHEKVPRNNFASKDDGKVYQQLLPVKMKNKLIPQKREVTSKKDCEDEEPEEEAATEEVVIDALPNGGRELSAAENMLMKEQKLAEAKKKMAILALSIIENPNEQIGKLRELRIMLDDNDPDLKMTLSKLNMITLMEVFKDIIPGYKIRKLTEKELQQKVSNDTKALQNFEESLLISYKHYIQYLWSVASRIKNNHGKCETKSDEDQILKEVAIQCLCELLINCHHFNFRNELVSFVVPCMNFFNRTASSAACEAVKQVFKNDKLGATSLEIVKAIEDIVKSKKLTVKPKVLDTFKSLKIKEIDIGQAKGKAEKEQRKQRLLKMSRHDRKREKQMERLQRELLETKASEDKKKKLEYNTNIIQHIFATYIRILKRSPDSALISVVLEGLAKFAHFVNIDYFEDLFGTLKSMIASETLTLKQTMQCALTAFKIISDQGDVLNIDPVHFYKYFYEKITTISAGNSSEETTLLLDSLEAMIFNRKKHVTQQRILAFMKRLSTLSLQSLPESSIAILGVVRSILHTFPYADIMFENDHATGSGVFMPEVKDPEYCNASNTCLWELHLLQKHVCPDVAKFASHVAHQAPLSGKGQLPPQLSKLSAMDLYDKYHKDSINMFKNGRMNKQIV